MDQPLVLALIAGLATAFAGWLILRAGEHEEHRLSIALGIDRESVRPAARPSLTSLVSRVVPDGLFSPLAWYPETRDFGPREIEEMKAVALLVTLLAVLLALLEPIWLVLTLAAPALARWYVTRVGRSRRDRERRVLDREVTNALDVLVLALEAGLPFDRALAAYADAIHSPLSDEISLAVRELEVGYRRREALDRLAARTTSTSLAALASRVRLAEEFGTPLASALRSLSTELRTVRGQRIQEAALRAPVTMLLPTAGLILVPIFALILGPIALRVSSGSLF